MPQLGAMTPNQIRIERGLLNELAGEAKGAAARVFESAGYHRHARGAWRLRRQQEPPTSMDLATRPLPGFADWTTAQLLEELKQTADIAKESRRFAVRFIEMFLAVGVQTEEDMIRLKEADPIVRVEETYLRRLAPADQVQRELLRRRVARLRADLEGSEPISAVERIIIDRAVACWLAVQDAELNLTRLIRDGERPRIPDQKRLDHAQRRLLDILKALDQVRRKIPASHRLKVMGDLHVHAPGSDAAPAPAPTVIELPAPSSPREDQP